MTTPATSTLTPDRLKVLVDIASGKRPEIQRQRLHWFIRHGYLVRLDVVGRPQVALTEQSKAIPEVAAAGSATGAPVATPRYASDAVKGKR